MARSSGSRGDRCICLSAINLFFSVERVEFEMALLKQRKIDGDRRVFKDTWTGPGNPDHYFFIARKSSVFSLFGNGVWE